MEHQIKECDSLIELLEAYQKNGASPEELAVMMKRHIEHKARMRAVPVRGTLELTPLCNLDCKMCYVHLSGQQFSNQTCSLLSGKQWIELIEQTIELGTYEVTLTGGEALLHPDFDEIFLFLEKKNVNITLKSNGLLLDDTRVAFLQEHYVSGIQISLYGSDNDSYEAVTGQRVFNDVLNAIERVQKAGIRLEVVITPSKYMWDNMEQLLRLVDSMGVYYSINPGLIEPLEETGRAGQSHDLTIEQYIQLHKLRASLHGVQIAPACLDEIPRTGGNHCEPVSGLRCGAGRSVFCVTWRGTVLPCRALEEIGFNGLITPFAEGWKKINEKVKQYPIPQECMGCEFEKVCTGCVVQHKMGAELGHASKAICYRARRFAEEGLIVKRK